MNARRVLLGSALLLGALVLGVLLYLTLGDLSVHKPRIERFVTEHTGRSFAINGPFELKVFPALSVVAKDVRLGNAPWGSQPSMVEVGRFATVIDIWSLISGPIEIRSLELRDIVALLETTADGKGNWVMPGAAESPPQPPQSTTDESGATEVPVVIEKGEVTNLRVTYRKPGAKDHVASLDSLKIAPGPDGLLVIQGEGALDRYAARVRGELGPIEALVSGRKMRMALDASLGRLTMNLKGSIGRLQPLDGVDLQCRIANPDVGAMLERLQLPVVATGSLSLDALLKDSGERTSVSLDAALGDLEATTTGSIKTLGLTGSDLQFTMTAKDAARLAAVFGVEGLPKEQLQAKGHVAASATQLDIADFTATFAGAEVRAKGSIPRTTQGGPKISFNAAAQSLAKLRTGLPDLPMKASATYVGSKADFDLQKLQLRIGETALSGALSVTGGAPRRVVATLSSPLVDLTTLLKEEGTQDAKKKNGAVEAQANSKKPAAVQANGDSKSQDKFVFDEKPLRLDKLRQVNAQVQMNVAEVVLKAGTLKDVAGNLKLDDGRLALDLQAKGTDQGTIKGGIHLIPSQNGADLTLQASIHDLRTGVFAPEGEDRSKAPTTNLELDIRAYGSSQRQMAAGANGKIVLTQGEGRVKSGLVNVFGSDILSQIGTQLNPFSTQDPVTTLQCSVAQVDIVNGQVTIKPVLMQSDKVTVLGHGTVDLRTEGLTFDFNTRPRRGIGVSAGMFANPFVNLGGTLAHPHLGTGAKGLASGALAVGTGGMSVLAKGLADRAAGEADLCQATLAEVSGSTKSTVASD